MRVGRLGEELEKTEGHTGGWVARGQETYIWRVFLCAQWRPKALRLHTHFTEEVTEPQGG